MRNIIKNNEIFLFIIIIILSILINSFNKSFLTLENLFDLLKSNSITGVMAIGFLVVLLSGGIDISFAAIATVSMYVTVMILNKFGGNIFLAFILAGFIGIILGSINAFFISYFKIPTLLTTLATLNIFHGLLITLGPSVHIYIVPQFFTDFKNSYIFGWIDSKGSKVGLSYLALVMIIIYILTWLILKYTFLGRNIYALGGNFDAAIRTGLKIWKIQLFVYCYIGFLSGIASILNVSLVRYVNVFSLVGTELEIIAAVILGGATLVGGKGSVIGTLLGVAFLVIIKTSFILMGIPSYWNNLFLGLIIIISIVITEYKNKRSLSLIKIS